MWPMILRICIMIAGGLLIIINLMSYFGKKINEKLAVLWLICGITMILAGIIPVLSDWSYVMCNTGYIALFAFLGIILMVIFKMTRDISVLRQKNQEIAMQVSLLNQENQRILSELEKIKEKSKTVE